jgi:hypothetical protein
MSHIYFRPRSQELRQLIGVSILAMSFVLSNIVHAEQLFRMNIDTPLLYVDGSPDIDENNSISFLVNNSQASSAINGRHHVEIDIPITVNGIDANHTVDVVDLPPGAAWSGSAITGSPTAVGPYHPMIEVRDGSGALVASQGLDLVVHPQLAASVSNTAYSVKVGDELTITPTASGVIDALQWGSTPSPLPSWMNFDALTGAIEVDTTAPRATSSFLLTAVDQADNAYASTSPFSITVNPSCSPWTSTGAEASQWKSVTYGNGTFVAVAYYGTNRVMTSLDGVNWTARPMAARDWSSVTFGNGMFVAVTSFGPVMTSSDGVTWTARTAAQANDWQSVTYGNGMFVAVASNGTHRVMTSPDGVTWTARAAAEANLWKSVTYGNGTFVAVAYYGTNRVMTSPDGVTWTARVAAEDISWQSVAHGNDLFVAVGAGGTNMVMTSPDGVTWTARQAAEVSSWLSVVYGDGMFVAVAGSGTNRVMTSPDGVTWSATTAAAAASSYWQSVTFGNGVFIAVASSGPSRVMVSDCR